jgi:hypothetical protein
MSRSMKWPQQWGIVLWGGVGWAWHEDAEIEIHSLMAVGCDNVRPQKGSNHDAIAEGSPSITMLSKCLRFRRVWCLLGFPEMERKALAAKPGTIQRLHWPACGGAGS